MFKAVLHGLQNASLQCRTACRSHGEQTHIVVPHRFPHRQGRTNNVHLRLRLHVCRYIQTEGRLANVSYCENQKKGPEIHLAIVSVFATTTTVPFTTMLVVLVCLVTLGP